MSAIRLAMGAAAIAFVSVFAMSVGTSQTAEAKVSSAKRAQCQESYRTCRFAYPNDLPKCRDSYNRCMGN
jgi:hypothetical protein